MYLFHQQLETLLHINSWLCAYFHERHAIFFCKCFSLFCAHLPFIIEVSLGGKKYLADITGRVVVNLRYPSVDILKWVAVDDGICEYDSCCSLIVGLGNIFEAFLSGCVPDLESVSAVADSHSFYLEVYADGGDVWLFECAFAEASYEYCFADAAIAYDDDFGHEIVLLCFFWGGHR